MKFLSWSKIALGFAIDILFLLVLSLDAKDHFTKVQEKNQPTTAPEPAVDQTDE